MNQEIELNPVTRPPLRIYGGGWLRAKWTGSFFPPHENYLEPCFGGGSILFEKRMVAERPGEIDKAECHRRRAFLATETQ